MFKKKNKQWEMLWFLFPQTILKEARTWKKITISASWAAHWENEWINKAIWEWNRKFIEINSASLESKCRIRSKVE